MVKLFQNINNILECTLSNKNDYGSKRTNNYNEVNENSSTEENNYDKDSIKKDVALFCPNKK